MKNVLIAFFTVQTFVSFGQLKPTKTSDVVIKNVSVITMKNDSVLNNRDVVIKDGRVISIEKSTKKKQKGGVVIDGKGKFIMPTLSDAHVHFPEDDAEFEKILKLNLLNGVTKLRSMRGDWKHIELRNKYNTADSYYPKLYLSPPPISRGYDLTIPQIEDYVKKSKEHDFEFIKILSIQSQSTFIHLDSICKKYNISIAGHYPRLASGNEINEALLFKSNYTSFEHLGGLAGVDTETLNRRINLLKVNKIFICPTLSWYSIGSGQYSLEESRTLPGMEFVSQSIMDEWIEGTKKYREKLGDAAYREEVENELKALEEKYSIIKKLNDNGVQMLLSPDASSKYMISGSNVLGEMELLKKAQLSNFEILKMATVNFATFFKEKYGTIELGKDADFMLLDKNPIEDLQALKNIRGLYFNRHFIDAKALEALRSDLVQTKL